MVRTRRERQRRGVTPTAKYFGLCVSRLADNQSVKALIECSALITVTSALPPKGFFRLVHSPTLLPLFPHPHKSPLYAHFLRWPLGRQVLTTSHLSIQQPIPLTAIPPTSKLLTTTSSTNTLPLSAKTLSTSPSTSILQTCRQHQVMVILSHTPKQT